MKPAVVVLLAFGLIFAVTATKVDYSGHMVIRTIPKTEDQLDFLAHLQSTTSMDFWSIPGKVNGESAAVIRVSPDSYYHVARSLAEQGLDHTIFISDLGALERKERQAIALRKAVFNHDKAIDLENYHTYDEIMTYLDELVATYPTLVSKRVASQRTSEGREIVQVTISSGGSNTRPVIFFDCNIHAREWISPATCTWIIDHLVTNYGVDSEVTNLIDTHDWKFVPVTNPDGYVYTWNSDRLWRKNRVENGGNCVGVDVNRNFETGFGLNGGSSNLECSDTYHGSAPFSEQESQAIRELVQSDQGRVKAALSIHSYSQVWLSPWGYQNGFPADYPEMERVMTVGVNALTATYGTQYEYGSTSSVLYIASGVTTDYYYANQGILHSYTIELRDTGRYGFELPPDQIVPTATETWNGIKAFVQAI